MWEQRPDASLENLLVGLEEEAAAGVKESWQLQVKGTYRGEVGSKLLSPTHPTS